MDQPDIDWGLSPWNELRLWGRLRIFSTCITPNLPFQWITCVLILWIKGEIGQQRSGESWEQEWTLQGRRHLEGIQVEDSLLAITKSLVMIHVQVLNKSSYFSRLLKSVTFQQVLHFTRIQVSWTVLSVVRWTQPREAGSFRLRLATKEKKDPGAWKQRCLNIMGAGWLKRHIGSVPTANIGTVPSPTQLLFPCSCVHQSDITEQNALSRGNSLCPKS